MTAYEDLPWLTIKNRSIYEKTCRQNGSKIFRMYVCFIILLPFCFRYALFYHKSEHKNLLELIVYSMEVLMVSEFC